MAGGVFFIPSGRRNSAGAEGAEPCLSRGKKKAAALSAAAILFASLADIRSASPPLDVTVLLG